MPYRVLSSMGFAKTCPVCNENFSPLVTYMSHIKNNHNKESPQTFVREAGELKWRLRNDD
ncbi:hypothetical protein C5F47_03815 [Nitrosopumilus cobalaminigenes]|uniref:C2H2-type domain-containing protein n=1 Tax=Nitrosopumilus cobalaminigenes TaxID=1470066 RepID=A0A7D5R6F1_9ARCH|nr:hypothetical protein [Nitrosopumilus cobalaminigenes]QLH02742.1 hypothetical protein C5F47_03815 [Nitrosopumilus cobalaminigenes]